MAAALWRSGIPSAWLDSLQAYPDRLKALEKDGLEQLDSWYRALPAAIAERGEEPYITADELVRIVEWKLKRGMWRPRLLDYAKAHSDETVRAASSKAFRLAAPGDAQQISAVLAPLTKLKGVGPATASAALAAAQPAFPFMSDEAMQAAVKGPLKYTLPDYVQLVEAAQAKASELNEADGEHVWTASDVERSLWSCAVADKPRKPAARRKRKAE